jgi:hypothetical protein
MCSCRNRVGMRQFKRLRAWIKPEIREGLDAFAMFMAVVTFFGLIQAAHDGIANRNHDFDSGRWWYPVYKLVYLAPDRALPKSD